MKLPILGCNKRKNKKTFFLSVTNVRKTADTLYLLGALYILRPLYTKHIPILLLFGT